MIHPKSPFRSISAIAQKEPLLRHGPTLLQGINMRAGTQIRCRRTGFRGALNRYRNMNRDWAAAIKAFPVTLPG
ncbi:hypothetical protein SAMN05421505_14320 [Sinosporangium album]|uniref:Uncharacterized protein n=1 Tax=Sinosporangium album TaxID=504805 RepID=A0A1G8JGM8_9ACTN|nr:hypothetical protein SAMN05421505_14320 [Sinosporangium album]